MQRIYLMRHGDAEGRAASGRDADRCLTPEGIRRVKHAARGLRRLELRGVQVVSSPFARALETARLVAEGLGRSAPAIWPELASGADPESIVDRLRALDPEARVLLVGHEPDLGRTVSHLLTGDADAVEVDVGKGSVCALRASRLPPFGRATLKWFLRSEILEALGK